MHGLTVCVYVCVCVWYECVRVRSHLRLCLADVRWLSSHAEREALCLCTQTDVFAVPGWCCHTRGEDGRGGGAV